MIDFSLLFAPLAEHGQVVYYAYDLHARRLTYVSPAYARVFGGSPELVNEELPELKARMHPDDLEFLADKLAQAPNGQLIEDLELRLKHPDGRRQWLCLTAVRVLGPDNRAYISGSAQDITRTKQYMDNAHKYNAKKNATLEILSHDLAGPLVVAQQLAEHIAQQSAVYQDATLNELIRLLHETCKDSVDLIRDFVDQEFMESASVVLKRERVDMVAWVNTVVEEYQRSAQKLDKHFHFIAPSDPIYVSCDKNKFEQVLNNLISNSIKFTHDGGHITVKVEPAGTHVRVSVSDDGIGIPENLQPLLFDKFTKARRPGLRGEKTTGLGMSVIKTIVGLHEGRITFRSEENKGSSFCIELPASAPLSDND
ncbi:PAS domain-containing sensor histidine kinase [Hymenobacter latericus]|uniref:PAS domain-containing sensor histidine kinase n=1 Tax=Hymenobacter sp. YIM 151858-1 TaxID=2987688 RepID=UPI002226AC4E|nr:PAS domain-containing sensor histidine kinase [Hymenobacter sp. YIM 151858-1]UYZ59541.1 PAS domain-containing sensor histidine kinase [Hymenobacter sp. YIM 151858-1]